ncbi:carbohydrate kinase [Pseudoalteromonas piscicida]|uniref:Fructokinase n=1 Tax=Pseudoalteromonas piscicida TaxID=43662 RepID=A0ABM6NM42_PSEO7|nr:carbohydrate kinase [Pseudoalteromonas piscicida]ATD10089.1 fructokinase [Pseudoalteromonas piscicida]WPU31948.1 carbohydrate kinase [Pseudoalteromonas piscicida]
MQLTCFGEMLIDLLPTGDGSLNPIAGGAPANVAVGFAKLGGSARFVGGFAEDPFSLQLKSTLALYAVGTEYCVSISGAQTALAIVHLDAQGERSFSFYRDNTADIAIRPKDFEHLQWPDHGIFHFCSNTLTDAEVTSTTMALLKSAAAHNQLISFDVNLRLGLWQDLSCLSERIETCYPYVDILKMSKDELRYLAEEKNMREASYLDWLLSVGVQAVISSDGPNPCSVLTAKDFYSVASPTIDAVDTTGAGDSLMAGFLFQLSQHGISKDTLSQNFPTVKKALSFAVKCGAFTCEHKGIMPFMPTLIDVSERFSSFNPEALLG